MRLWTIQTQAAWAHAQKIGQLQANPDFIEPYFIPSYDWLVAQMTQRIEGFVPQYPIWSWITKPDLRYCGCFLSGKPGVRLTLEVPAEEVVLSDFSLWHYVLNGRYLADSDVDSLRFDYLLARTGGHRRLKDMDDYLQEQVMQSWTRIFHLDHLWSDGVVQATTGPISLNQVLKVEPFIAR